MTSVALQRLDERFKSNGATGLSEEANELQQAVVSPPDSLDGAGDDLMPQPDLQSAFVQSLLQNDDRFCP